MTSDLPLTPEDVNEIAAILDGSQFDRLDLRTQRFRLRVERQGEGWTQSWSLEDDSSPMAAPTIVPVAAPAQALPEGHVGVEAPLPGTFYRAPQPGAPPFVEMGDAVTPDTVVGIVETMKLMNPVHAGCSGRVVALCVENGEMVDTGQALMHVQTA